MPDYEALKFWLSVANTVGLCLIGIYSWWTSRGRATAAAIEAARVEARELHAAVHEDVSVLERRVSQAEHELTDRLRLKDLAALYESSRETNRELGEISAKVGALATQVGRVQDYLLRGKD